MNIQDFCRQYREALVEEYTRLTIVRGIEQLNTPALADAVSREIKRYNEGKTTFLTINSAKAYLCCRPGVNHTIPTGFSPTGDEDGLPALARFYASTLFNEHLDEETEEDYHNVWAPDIEMGLLAFLYDSLNPTPVYYMFPHSSTALTPSAHQLRIALQNGRV